MLRASVEPKGGCHANGFVALAFRGRGGGSAARLWRYAVKSMTEEELNAAEVTERGLGGVYAEVIAGGAIRRGDSVTIV